MSHCSSCPAEIVWGRTPTGKAMPLDAAPDPNGMWVLDDGNIRKAEESDTAPHYTSHFATCPNAKTHRKEKS